MRIVYPFISCIFVKVITNTKTNIMKKLIILVVVLMTALFSYATEPTDPPTDEKEIYFGHYRQSINYLGRLEKSNTFIYKAQTKTAFERLTKKFITESNKGYIKNLRIVVRYKNQKTTVKL